MEVPARLCGDMEPENDKNKERTVSNRDRQGKQKCFPAGP